jgi:hypothetical protein
MLLFQNVNWAYNSFFVCVYVHVLGRKSHRQCKNRNFISVESFKTNLAERVESGTSTSGEGPKGGGGWCICGNEPSCVAYGCMCLHYLAKLPFYGGRCYLVAAIHMPLISIRLQCDCSAITIWQYHTIRYFHSDKAECSPTSCTSFIFASSLEFA